eukprot:364861-Chlamydomonas_euryale.AAC.26
MLQAAWEAQCPQQGGAATRHHIMDAGQQLGFSTTRTKCQYTHMLSYCNQPQSHNMSAWVHRVRIEEALST